MVKKIAANYYAEWEFAAVIGAGEEFPIKPNPAGVEKILAIAGVRQEEALYVGDTEVDIETARNAGLDSAFVSWGFRRLEEVPTEGITYIIHRPEQLAELLKSETTEK